MSSFSRDLIFLVLQYLDEEKFKDTVHKLEQESGLFFNMRYFEDAITNGEWDEVDKYLSGFIKVDDNRFSMKIFFEIRKQKYLEALDKRDYEKAVEVLRKDLKVFSSFNDELYKEITYLLTLTNFRDNEQLSRYEDAKTARRILLGELKKLIEANPLFRDKLQFPTLKNSRLQTLINQSLNWQHHLCNSLKPNTDIKTLFVDHKCAQPNGAPASSPVTNQLMGSMPKVGGFPPLGAHGPFLSAPQATSVVGWMVNPSSVPHPAISGGPMGLSTHNNAASLLKRTRSPPTNNPALDYRTADSEQVLKRIRPFGTSEEVNNNIPIKMLGATYPGLSHAQTSSYSSDDLPKTVVAILKQGSAVKSMDFHPVQQTLLLVGTNIGDIALWEVVSRARLALRNFKVWDLKATSVTLQASLANEYTASVNHVLWSPDGTLLGVAFSKHIVQLYSCCGGDYLRNHIEIDAHVGNISDLAFSNPNKQLCVITCGDDKAIKVWDTVTGSRQYIFEGHEAPVYSICAHHKEGIQFIFSTSVDGKMKAWLYDNVGSRVDYSAPGQSCTKLAYTADGTRLFSCGTSNEGESHIVEWNESEGAVKRSYIGLGNRSMGVVQFDTMRNRFLAAGDEFLIKFWDIDNVNLLTTTNADGGLPASPCIRFNKQGILLAVSTSENGVKILGNAEGRRALAKSSIDGAYGASSSSAGPNIGVAETGTPPVTVIVPPDGDSPDINTMMTDEMEKSKIWKLTEINEQAELRSLRLPDSLLPVRISRLIYTHSGNAILALPYNGVHKFWRWERNEVNLTGRATTTVPPQFSQPAGGILMTNDTSDRNLEDAVSCLALSNNDSYLMSASGGKISLFNMVTFRTMTTFMAPPPAATSIAVNSQDNNIIAVGMEDSSILIYDVRLDEVISNLQGHEERVTGLAFSVLLEVLVSSGADAQLCVWSMDGWVRQASKFLEIPSGRAPSPLRQTRVQFHQDQTHVLVVDETQIAIYKAPKLECIKQWFPRDSSGTITDATYSCDGRSIFASFENGSIIVLTAELLRLRCRINPSAYLPSNPSSRVYPLVIAAHPIHPNQLALGLTDGGVHVLEPLESEGRCGAVPPLSNGVGPSRHHIPAIQLVPRGEVLENCR